MQPLKRGDRFLGTMNETLDLVKPVTIRQFQEKYLFTTWRDILVSVTFSHRVDGHNQYIGVTL